MAAFARKAPEARDVRALMDGEAPWASETHPRVALSAEGSLDANFKTCAYVRSDGGGDERLRVEVRAKAPGERRRVDRAAEFSRDDLVRAREPVMALRAGAAPSAARRRSAPTRSWTRPRARRPACARRSCWTTAASWRGVLRERRRARDRRDVLKPVADGATRAAAAWLARAERERVVRCAFAGDDSEAHGARKLRVAVLGARA